MNPVNVFSPSTLKRAHWTNWRIFRSWSSGVDPMEGLFSSSARSQLILLSPPLTNASIYKFTAWLSPR